MSFNPTNFKMELSNLNGVSRSAHFQVEISLPNVAWARNYDTKILKLTAISSNIPSMIVDTVNYRRGAVTNIEAFPVNVTYSDLSITFLSDGKGEVLRLFKAWLDSLFISREDDAERFRVAYRDDYLAKSLKIRHFDPTGKQIVEYTFIDAFPYHTGDISLNWGAFNDVVSINVNFKYRLFTHNGAINALPVNIWDYSQVAPGQPDKSQSSSLTPQSDVNRGIGTGQPPTDPNTFGSGLF